MANANQLALLKNALQNWNIWRTPISLHPKFRLEDIDLREADLRGMKLVEAELYAADLRRANLSGAKLIKANLSEANLDGADLSGANLNETNLCGASLNNANLSGANLSGANLNEADLNAAILNEAILSRASLIRASLTKANISKAKLDGASLLAASLEYANLNDADLSRTDLRSTDLTGASLVRTILNESIFLYARVGNTIFGNLDLSDVRRLGEVSHHAPSTIGIDTIAKSKGKIPPSFLQGCGLSNLDIEVARLYDPDLSNDDRNKTLHKISELTTHQALQISPLFISYSHDDGDFVDKLDDCLTKKGIRFWRDIHDMKAGKIEKQIDSAMSQNSTVLLVLSINSLSSDWVEHEVRLASGLEKDKKRDMLCPVALDDSWKSSPWPKHIMEQIMEYNILDFSAWEDDPKFEGMFRKLIDGLELFYKG